MNFKKIGYVIVMGGLTLTALNACKWQTFRYIEARKRWAVIKQELNKEDPDQLGGVAEDALFPFRHVSVDGRLGQHWQRIDRMRNGRMGYLVTRPLLFQDSDGQQKQMLAVQGWCEQNHEYTPSQGQPKRWKGILRSAQKKDYTSKNFSKEDISKFSLTTYIDPSALLTKLNPSANLKQDPLSQQYYLQLLKPLSSQVQEDTYPYRYSVDNFELPYLTPDKHISYALFWGGTGLIGLSALFKVLRRK